MKHKKSTGNPTWLDNLYKRMWAHYIVSSDGCFYLVDGVKIPALEFEKRYPIK